MAYPRNIKFKMEMRWKRQNQKGHIYIRQIVAKQCTGKIVAEQTYPWIGNRIKRAKVMAQPTKHRLPGGWRHFGGPSKDQRSSKPDRSTLG